LDSSSIACVAARYLQNKGKSLKGFNAVPMEGYHDWTASQALADETPYVEAISRHAGNIQAIYRRATGRHVLNTTERISTIVEQPYKYFANALWIDDLLENAAGQHGIWINAQRPEWQWHDILRRAGSVF
jgi:asparagine synthase (glutamine-hydrolysing)